MRAYGADGARLAMEKRAPPGNRQDRGLEASTLSEGDSKISVALPICGRSSGV
jgi:hypothetical protein